jgi:hypothetical protein
MMKGYRTKRAAGLALLPAAAFALLLVLPAAAEAQRPNPIEVYNARRAARGEELRRRRELENVSAEARGARPSAAAPRPTREQIEQVKEDFNTIQVLNNEMVRATFSGQTPDYGSLYGKAGEMKKRANRLKESIKFTESEGAEKSRLDDGPYDEARMRISVLALRNLVKSFVTNPLFRESAGALDVNLAAKASRDLRGIADLSDAIRKNAKRLDKKNDE